MLCIAILATFSLPVPHYTEMIINCIIWSLGKLTLRKHDNWMSKNCQKLSLKKCQNYLFFSKKLKKMKIFGNFFEKNVQFLAIFWQSNGNFPEGQMTTNSRVFYNHVMCPPLYACPSFHFRYSHHSIFSVYCFFLFLNDFLMFIIFLINFSLYSIFI